MARKLEEYALHVCRDGREVRFRQKPTPYEPIGSAQMLVIGTTTHFLPVHAVAVLQLESGEIVEETTIDAIKFDGGSHFKHPRPHGKGWAVHAENEEKWTTFRRPMPTGERPIFNHLDDWPQ